MRTCKSGFFIAIEGGDGVGKSTVAKMLKEKIEQQSKQSNVEESLLGWNSTSSFDPIPSRVVLTREPYKYRDEIIQCEFTNWLRLLYIFIRDREAHTDFIEPLLDDDKIVITDRYYHSLCVYQSLQSGLPMQDILQAHPDWCIKPHLTIILDGDAEIAFERNKKKQQTTNDQNVKPIEMFDERWNFQKEVFNLYRELGEDEFFNECVIVPASGSPEQVTNHCLNLFNNFYFKHKLKYLDS